MTPDEALAAILAGAEILADEANRGLDVVAAGEMGIANTTASSAIVAAICGASVADVTGHGTGLDEEGVRHKIEVIERALAVNQPDPSDPLDVLAKVGGFEIAGLVGVILAPRPIGFRSCSTDSSRARRRSSPGGSRRMPVT